MPSTHETNRDIPDPQGLYRTRYALLGYQHQGHRIYGSWRVIDIQTGRAIGPQYVYHCELLADLDRFAAVYGY